MAAILDWLSGLILKPNHHPFGFFVLFAGGGLFLALLSYFLLDRYAHRLVTVTATQLDDYFLRFFKFPIALSFGLGGLWHGLNSFPLIASVGRLIFSVLATFTILSWTFAAFRFTSVLVDHMAQQTDRFRLVQERTKPLFQMLFKSVAVLVSTYMIIIAWGQDVTGWLASAGVVGIALGFAAKDTLANFLAGVFIIADSPYKIGDFIQLESGERGRVTDIGLRSTRLVTLDDVEVIIPNAIMGNTKVINQSGGPFRKMRVRVPVSVAYGSDLQQVRSSLLKIAKEDSKVESEPVPRVRIRELGASGINLELLVWASQPDRRDDVIDTLLEQIHNKFRAEQIEIPYQKVELMITQWNKREG